MAKIHSFETLEQAIEAGYELPGNEAADTSGTGSFGYSFAQGARRTIGVSLTQVRNKIGQLGAVQAMFPPESE